KVIDKRDTSDFDVSRRRRECLTCTKRFTTYERIESLDLTVIKSDGRAESFDREKLKSSILKACDKRSISEEKVETLVNDIESTLKQEETVDVQSSVIGSLIMDKLKVIDKIAYLRYASVHLMFEDVNSFEHEIEKLRQNKNVVAITPTMVKKRTGFLVDFDKNKITESIFKAAEMLGGKDKDLATQLADDVTNLLSIRFPGGSPNVDDIEDAIEETLVKKGHAKTAKAYIISRYHDKKLRDNKSTFVDVTSIINSYMNQSDWRVKENSNTDFSFSGLVLHTSGAMIANYVLSEIYPPEISEAHNKGYFHLHDLSCGVVGYCAGWSLKTLLIRGFGNVPNKVDTKPAKHMDVVVGQMVNFIGCLQMEFAGAQAFNSVDTLLAPFVRT
ncbi:MAG TPA: transcriptional regulator NrdR, partial [Candidatus Nanoarchaeia archaeon]|nr:transcriptional regulator NrdR [Candidatus Nanoarchaeia archaeon]